MSVAEWFLLFLRLAHSLAAAVWLGGGVYYLVALRPAIHASGRPPDEVVKVALHSFGEWARTSTVVMIATGVVLMFDRLATDGEGIAYAALLTAKIVSALAAFWMVGNRQLRRARNPNGRSRSELVLTFGLVAFVLGVALSSVYGRA